MELSELRTYIQQKISHQSKSVEIPEDSTIFQERIASDQLNRIINNEIIPYEFYRDRKNSRIAVMLEGTKNCIIDGKGAVIRVNGMLIPFYLENCENVTLQNFTIQYDTLTHTEGIVRRRGLSSFDVHLSDTININGSVPIMAWIEYDAKTRLLGKKEAYIDTRGEILDKNTIRIPIPAKFQRKVPKLGQGIILRHIITHHAGIQLFNCKNITIRNVEINEAYWGALVGHRVENLTVDNLRVIPRDGNIFSTNADACHLISCSGLVKFENCEFEGHGDDALNVHTMYYSIKRIINSHELIAELKKEQQDRIMDYPDAGDIFEFTRLRTLNPYTSNKILSVNIEREKKHIYVRFEEPIPSNLKKSDVLANATKAAQVHFINNKIYNNRARGILIQSRDVLIENNEFVNCTGTGIYITCSKYWWEALSSRNIQIRNNSIKDCGGGPGTMDASGITVKTEAAKHLGVHQDVVIEGNSIVSYSKKLPSMYLSSIFGLILHNNTVSSRIVIRKSKLKD
ncbi:MAG: right-handed parallel beta-helix repeat-containing protein [Promethearchaeota archaeon]